MQRLRLLGGCPVAFERRFRQLEEGALRIRALDSELLDANQRRQDAFKRIDELISHLDQLDAQLSEAGD